MTTSLHPAERCAAIDPRENRRFVAFVDHCFGRPEGQGLRREFPTALAETNHRHQFVLREGDEWIAAATALRRTWWTSAGPVDVACLGCFSTRPDRRGAGASRRLQEWMIARLEAEGAQWMALWTDRPEFYSGRGFAPAGREWHALLSEVVWPGAEADLVVGPGGPEDADSMLGLYARHRLRAERSVEDMRALCDRSVSKVLLARRQGRIVGYACVGKGADFVGFVHEYAGEPREVRALFARAVAEGARLLLVPEGAQTYVEDVVDELPMREMEVALVRRGAGAPDPSRCHWAVWGGDSA